jgi:hypothetical protein
MEFGKHQSTKLELSKILLNAITNINVSIGIDLFSCLIVYSKGSMDGLLWMRWSNISLRLGKLAPLVEIIRSV